VHYWYTNQHKPLLDTHSALHQVYTCIGCALLVTPRVSSLASTSAFAPEALNDLQAPQVGGLKGEAHTDFIPGQCSSGICGELTSAGRAGGRAVLGGRVGGQCWAGGWAGSAGRASGRAVLGGQVGLQCCAGGWAVLGDSASAVPQG
jgi:hypothetical protein